MGVGDRRRTGTTGSHAGAAAELQKTLKSDPNDTRALLRLAELEAKAGQAAACEMYSRAGDIFVRQGFARRALSAFALALAVARERGLADRVGPIARAMGSLYVRENLVRDAVTTLDGAARWMIARGRDAGALPLLEARIAIEDTEVARVRLGETFLRLREPEKGVTELTAAFRRLQAQGRRDEALDVAERLLAERRDVAIARAAAELYLARRRSGDPFLALAKLRICCDAGGTHVPTLELLARAFDLAGHADKATRVRREIALLAPETSDGARPIAARANALAVPRDDLDAPPNASRAQSVAVVAAVPPRPSAVPPRPSAIRPKRLPASARAKEDSVDCAWDDLLVDDADEPSKDVGSERIDPARPSFWLVDEAPAADKSGSVVSVSLADVELVDGIAPQSSEPPASLLETALECIDSLFAQGRYPEASALVARHLTIRPRNPLLIERQAEIEGMLTAHIDGPPPALFGFPRKAVGERRAEPPTRAAVRAS